MGFLSERKKAGLTQFEVAEKVGVDQSAVSFWENGKYLPRASILMKLAKLYHCTVDELLREEDKE